MTYYRRAQRWAMLLVLTLVCAACSRAQPTSPPVLEAAGVLELPYAIQSMAWHPNGKWLAVGYFMRDEVEVWDVQTKKALFAVPSQRRPVRHSQEVLFTSDSKYLVVQDFKDLKRGVPPFPRTRDDPEELPARADKERYVLARVWNLESRTEVAQIKGPGSVVYGGVMDGMCMSPTRADQLVVHRNTVIATYDIRSGILLQEIDASHPFADKPDQRRGYWKMVCHPARSEVALEGAKFFKEAPAFGFEENSGATPIVVLDLEKKAVKKVLFSATPLNGVAYTADGGKLVSFGAPPIRVWDANADFAAVGEINDPNENTGDFTTVPGYDGVFGIANNMHLWHLGSLRSVEVVPIPRDVFRVALHSESGIYAVASGASVHLYRLNTSKLATLNAQRKE